MNHLNVTRNRSRQPLRATPVAAAVAALLCTSEFAFAQQAAETITITGIRRGIESAINIKKNNDSIVEAISAEDIGKLPDVSVAESISRLPGVAAQRTAGRAQQISIRGLAPDFATALLNGREQVTTGDSRGVEFDQYPGELLSGVVVYKTPDGALVGQGLSGTIDLQTVRPLSLGKRTIAANLRKQRTGIDSGGDTGSGTRESFAYIDQFADRTIGVAIGFARFTEDGAQSQRFDSWGGWTPDMAFGGGTAKVPGGFARWVDQTKQTREGTTGTLQYKPNKDFESTLDIYYSKFQISTSNRGFQAPIAFGNTPNGQQYDPDGVLTAATVLNGVATSGTVNNFKAVIRSDVQDTKDKLTSIGWNNKLNIGGWKAVADISTSKATRTGQILETTAGQAGNTPGASLDSISWTGFNGSNFADVLYTTKLNYADRAVTKLTDVEGWGGGTATPQAGYSKLPNVEDKLSAVRLSGKTPLKGFGWLADLELGFNVTDRSKTRAYIEGRLVLPGSAYAAVDMPGSAVVSAGGFKFATWDPAGSVGSVYQVASKLVRDIANKDWTVKEKVTTAYAKADMDGDLFGIPLRGNLGLQAVGTNQSSTAFNVDGGACPGDVCPVTNVGSGRNYTDLLPSANLVFDIGRDQIVRFGAAEVLARPTINDMRASLGFGVDTGNSGGAILKGDAGNPQLKPFKAKALDLSYEKYFGTKAYFGAAAFYKKLDTYIVSTTSVFDFAPYISPTTPLPSTGPSAGKALGLLTQKTNGSGGSIQGIELSANLPLSLVTSWLDGFGAYASYSSTNSSISLPASGFGTDGVSTSTIPLPGLSKKVDQVAVYYEKYGFSVRWAQRHRSDFVGDITDIFGDRKLTYIKGERVADVQIGYEFQSGMLKGLSILGQALNIGNEPFVRYKDTPQNEVERVKYGKTYLFGLNYKL